jgi:hypothetical protein
MNSVLHKNCLKLLILSMLMVVATSALFAQKPSGGHFKLAIAEPLRHESLANMEKDVKLYKQNGYNAIWIENDYLRWSFNPDPDNGFSGNWRLFNIFDFTYGSHVKLYHDYLTQLCRICKTEGMDIYASFWLPKMNSEMLALLRKTNPGAIGIEGIENKKDTVFALCTCSDGKGLAFLNDMIKKFMTDYPQVKGLKVATFDNAAAICTEVCPNAHGINQSIHLANMFETIQKAMREVRPDAELLLYPWYWRDDQKDIVTAPLKQPYHVVVKMEKGSFQQLEEGIQGEELFDASMVSGKPGPDILYWIKKVGAENIIDMAPVGTGVDDWYLAAPPFPGRVYRRFHILDSLGVKSFMDYECGGHHHNSVEAAVGLFNQNPKLNEEEFLKELSKKVYHNSEAQVWAIKGWQAFDQGFGKLPMGLGATDNPQFSGRFGQAWSFCIATPMIFEAYKDVDSWHYYHWFSPYNFFKPSLSNRLQTWFTAVIFDWQEASRYLAMADALEGHTDASAMESVAAEAHLLAAMSALNWCNAARLLVNQKDKPQFNDLARNEIKLTEKFLALTRQYPWIWDNNCWHPHHTPLSQRNLGIDNNRFHNTFESKLFIMKSNFK